MATAGEAACSYKGKDYHVKVQGLTIGNVGAAQVEAVGRVFHLRKLGDFTGNSTSATASVTVAGGAGVTAMQSQNGVEIELTSPTRGLDFILAPGGV